MTATMNTNDDGMSAARNSRQGNTGQNSSTASRNTGAVMPEQATHAHAGTGWHLPLDLSSRGTRVLAALFGVQLLITGALLVQDRQTGNFTSAGPLLPFQSAAGRCR